MAFVSVTRLRLRAARFFPQFFWNAVRSQIQARKAEGNLRVDLRRTDGAWWTLTVWRDQAAMRAFMLSGSHRAAMPYLQTWCDEASLAHWETDALPSWHDAEQRLARDGRVSTVKYPSAAQTAGHTLGTSARGAIA